jgi:hypothetical protein
MIPAETATVVWFERESGRELEDSTDNIRLSYRIRFGATFNRTLNAKQILLHPITAISEREKRGISERENEKESGQLKKNG